MARSSYTTILFMLTASVVAACQVLLDFDRNEHVVIVEVEAGTSSDGASGDDGSADQTSAGDERTSIDGEVGTDAKQESGSGLSPTPGTVDCWPAPCTPGQECCWLSANDATCTSAGSCNGGARFVVNCDDAVDCASTEQCCLDAPSRQTSCWSGTCLSHDLPTACRTDDECPTGSVCTDWLCPRGPTIRTCGRGGFNSVLCYP